MHSDFPNALYLQLPFISGGHLQQPVRCDHFPYMYLTIAIPLPQSDPLNNFIYLNFTFPMCMLLPYLINNAALLVNQH